MRTVLFEDPLVSQLDPLALARPAYLLSCGGTTLYGALGAIVTPVESYVRPHLRAIEDADRTLTAHGGAVPETTLLLNGAVVPTVATIRTLNELVQLGKQCVVRNRDQIAAAVVPAGFPLPLNPTDSDGYQLLKRALDEFNVPDEDYSIHLLRDPHDLVAEHVLNFADTLEDRIARNDFTQLADGVFVTDPNTTIDSLIRCDTSKGPILIEENVSIGPFTYLRGPLHIGKNAIINEHASLKDNVWVGNNAKVGGEVEESVIEPFSNKQHHGFLGHSYIGSWVNLGAGTSNSDLKNTYGQIRIDYDYGRCDTGMQFLGCMIGDYTKSAINTSIFTGKVIGACSMLYGFITTNVPSFANYARTFGQVTELPADVLIDTQRRMFTRRRITQRPIDIQLLRDMNELVREKRQLVEERLAL
ncbi:MAG: hypothetical protein KDB27_25030 [Planctomycetales bacterium]|nr:hypothetical protein [Planctomycetales bacterium]